LSTPIQDRRLFKWLMAKDKDLGERALRVRAELTKWLPQIVQMFPHYPSHGVDHSDRIVTQLSKMLSKGNTLSASFSPVEVYCLLCAAYLHDMGMVVSPGDAAAILASDPWKTFVADGGKGHESYEKYLSLRNGPA